MAIQPQLVSIVDGYGWNVENTPFDEMKVALATGLLSRTFPGGSVDTNYWTVSGLVTQAHNQVEIDSGTGGSFTNYLQTITRSRYQAGTTNKFRATVQVGDLGIANNTRRWGVFDGTDGAYYELAGTNLSACVLRTGVRTVVATNIIPGLPVTAGVDYEIYITAGEVFFSIEDKLVGDYHALATTWADTYNLPIRFDNINSGNTTNVALFCRSCSVVAIGAVTLLNQWKNISTNDTAAVLKNSPGILRVVTNNNNAGTLTLYDALTATNPIATIDCTKVLGTNRYDLNFYTGLTYTTSGSPNITITWE